MDYAIKTYVSFMYLNTDWRMGGEISEVKPYYNNNYFDYEVENKKSLPTKIPCDAVCFYYYEIAEAEVEINKKPVILRSEKISRSERFVYSNARLITYEEICELWGKNRRLPLPILGNMERLEIKKILRIDAGAKSVYFLHKETDIFVPRNEEYHYNCGCNHHLIR